MTLNVAPNLQLPDTAHTQTLVVYGGKGMGKTNFGSVLVEELAKRDLRFSVIDALDVWWGLQHGATKSARGLDLVILGGPHGDIPIEPTAGAAVADFVADERASTVIVLRKTNGEMWTNGERIRFVTDYATRLFARQGERRIPLMQVIDEAGRFVPQMATKGDAEIAKCIGAIEQLVEWGRNVGVGVCLITQRSARMAKAVSELAECMVAFRTVGPNSISAIVDWFGEHVAKARAMELVEQLRSLERGSALVVSPGWLGFEGVAHIRARETFDSSSTPESGKSLRAPGQATKRDLEKYRVRMAQTIERATADDPKALRAKLAKLERELAAKPKPVEVEPERVEVPVLPAQTRADLQVSIAHLERAIEPLSRTLAEVAAALARVGQNGHGKSALPGTSPMLSRAMSARAATRAVQQRVDPGVDAERVSGPEQRILDAIAWLDSIDPGEHEQAAVAFLAGYTVGGGAFNNPRGAMRRKGLISYRGDRLALTAEGHALANAPEVALVPEELHARVLERLPGPEGKILRVLLHHYPESLSNEDLARAAGYEPRGGAFNNPRGRLRSLGLIGYPSPGQVAALPVLFLETK